MPTVVRSLELVQERTDLQRPAHMMIQAPGKDAVSLPLSNGCKVVHSTNTIAALLEASTGSDLIIAAAARLILIDGKDTVTRTELLKEMQGAMTFYKQTMSNNLSASLKALAKDDRLRLIGANTYALSQKERQKLEPKLAEAA